MVHILRLAAITLLSAYAAAVPLRNVDEGVFDAARSTAVNRDLVKVKRLEEWEIAALVLGINAAKGNLPGQDQY